MSVPISIRMAGYGPPTTSFSRGLKLIGDRLNAQFGDRVDVKYVWNIMDFGYKAEEIVWLVKHGVLTLGYQSSSYLTDRVPELGIVDLPFFFSSKEQARAAMDGALGERLTQATEQWIPYRVLGWFENGMRHISNRLRPLNMPSDLAGMKIRVLPSDIQARTFALLGAEPVKCDLTEAIAWIKEGRLDAQENPLANTVTYGVHKFHRFHTLTSHFYISRPIFVHRASFDAWPADVQQAMREAVKEAVAFQRGETVKEHEDSLAAIKAEGCDVSELSQAGHDAFAKAVQPLYDEARKAYGPELFKLLPPA
jgi:tripartite ATP-independent transporter DctP family solute receptor